MSNPGRKKLDPEDKQSVNVMVRLTIDEAKALDERRGAVPRATYLRETSPIYAPLAGEEAPKNEVRVNFRWTQASLAVVKRAAAMVGVPHQAWMKMVTWQAAIELLKAAGETDGA